MKIRFSIELRHFVAHETNIQSWLNRKGGTVGTSEIEAMADAAFEAHMAPELGKFCSILAVGHSDREDTPGLSSEQRRASELQASQQRADSALAWLLNQIGDRCQAVGLEIPLDWQSVNNVTSEAVAAGAAQLLNAAPVNEDQRQENRRLIFIVSGVNVDRIAAFDRQGFVLG